MSKLFILVLTLFAVSSINCKTDCQGKCPIAYKCSSEENVVWATDDNNTKCYVIRNQCQMNNMNCQRENNCEKPLKLESKENCQKLCKMCSDEYDPVCAYYNDKRDTFPSMCTLDSHICTTGETWSLFNRGACDSSSE